MHDLRPAANDNMPTPHFVGTAHMRKGWIFRYGAATRKLTEDVDVLVGTQGDGRECVFFAQVKGHENTLSISRFASLEAINGALRQYVEARDCWA